MDSSCWENHEKSTVATETMVFHPKTMVFHPNKQG
jgi:hypothetical protein